jgi:hypothetical protein
VWVWMYGGRLVLRNGEGQVVSVRQSPFITEGDLKRWCTFVKGYGLEVVRAKKSLGGIASILWELIRQNCDAK